MPENIQQTIKIEWTKMVNKGQTNLRGIFGITVTPFNDDESLDLKSLESVLNFTIDSGCHGIVTPVMVSEYQTLTDEERRKIFETAVKVANGKIPVVAGVTGVSTPHSVGLARVAQDLGVDAVIAMAPFSRPPTITEVKEFFRELDKNVNIPIFIQNHSKGSSLGAEQIVDIFKSTENVKYLKEESAFPGQITTRVLDRARNICRGIFGGASGQNIISEHHRGMSGNMPASHFGDPMSRLWEALESGDIKYAKKIHSEMLPILNFELIYGVEVFKHILIKRGVISNGTVRSPGRVQLDVKDHEEIDVLLSEIDHLLTWNKS